jgi:hypothetical protein
MSFYFSVSCSRSNLLGRMVVSFSNLKCPSMSFVLFVSSMLWHYSVKRLASFWYIARRRCFLPHFNSAVERSLSTCVSVFAVSGEFSLKYFLFSVLFYNGFLWCILPAMSCFYRVPVLFCLFRVDSLQVVEALPAGFCCHILLLSALAEFFSFLETELLFPFTSRWFVNTLGLFRWVKSNRIYLGYLSQTSVVPAR